MVLLASQKRFGSEVSGVEQTTAASFEARHSYTLDDIFWDRTGVDSCGLVDGQVHGGWIYGPNLGESGGNHYAVPVRFW